MTEQGAEDPRVTEELRPAQGRGLDLYRGPFPWGRGQSWVSWPVCQGSELFQWRVLQVGGCNHVGRQIATAWWLPVQGT